MVCNTNITGSRGKYYEAIWKDIQCEEIFDTDIFDRHVLGEKNDW